MPKPPTDPSEAGGPSKIGPDKTLEKGRMTTPDSSSFKAYKEEAPPAPGAQTTSEMTPMELASKTGISTTPTFSSLLAQSANAKDTLGDIEKNLKTPKLKFKKSQEELLKNKLSNANDHLKNAANKIGAKVPKETSKSGNPVQKFIGMVTDGQNKLVQVQNKLQQIKTDKGMIPPADMLLIQVKLSQAQQEIEYSSVLLSKVVDSLKQIINIQI